MSVFFFLFFFFTRFLTFFLNILYFHFFAQHEQKFQKNLDRTRALKQNMSNLKIFYFF